MPEPDTSADTPATSPTCYREGRAHRMRQGDGWATLQQWEPVGGGPSLWTGQIQVQVGQQAVTAEFAVEAETAEEAFEAAPDAAKAEAANVQEWAEAQKRRVLSARAPTKHDLRHLRQQQQGGNGGILRL